MFTRGGVEGEAEGLSTLVQYIGSGGDSLCSNLGLILLV